MAQNLENPYSPARQANVNTLEHWITKLAQQLNEDDDDSRARQWVNSITPRGVAMRVDALCFEFEDYADEVNDTVEAFKKWYFDPTKGLDKWKEYLVKEFEEDFPARKIARPRKTLKKPYQPPATPMPAPVPNEVQPTSATPMPAPIPNEGQPISVATEGLPAPPLSPIKAQEPKDIPMLDDNADRMDTETVPDAGIATFPLADRMDTETVPDAGVATFPLPSKTSTVPFASLAPGNNFTVSNTTFDPSLFSAEKLNFNPPKSDSYLGGEMPHQPIAKRNEYYRDLAPRRKPTAVRSFGSSGTSALPQKSPTVVASAATSGAAQGSANPRVATKVSVQDGKATAEPQPELKAPVKKIELQAKNDGESINPSKPVVAFAPSQFDRLMQAMGAIHQDVKGVKEQVSNLETEVAGVKRNQEKLQNDFNAFKQKQIDTDMATKGTKGEERLDRIEAGQKQLATSVLGIEENLKKYDGHFGLIQDGIGKLMTETKGIQVVQEVKKPELEKVEELAAGKEASTGTASRTDNTTSTTQNPRSVNISDQTTTTTTTQKPRSVNISDQTRTTTTLTAPPKTSVEVPAIKKGSEKDASVKKTDTKDTEVKESKKKKSSKGVRLAASGPGFKITGTGTSGEDALVRNDDSSLNILASFKEIWPTYWRDERMARPELNELKDIGVYLSDRTNHVLDHIKTNGGDQTLEQQVQAYLSALQGWTDWCDMIYGLHAAAEMAYKGKGCNMQSQKNQVMSRSKIRKLKEKLLVDMGNIGPSTCVLMKHITNLQQVIKNKGLEGKLKKFKDTVQDLAQVSWYDLSKMRRVGSIVGPCTYPVTESSFGAKLQVTLPRKENGRLVQLNDKEMKITCADFGEALKERNVSSDLIKPMAEMLMGILEYHLRWDLNQLNNESFPSEISDAAAELVFATDGLFAYGDWLYYDKVEKLVQRMDHMLNVVMNHTIVDIAFSHIKEDELQTEKYLIMKEKTMVQQYAKLACRYQKQGEKDEEQRYTKLMMEHQAKVTFWEDQVKSLLYRATESLPDYVAGLSKMMKGIAHPAVLASVQRRVKVDLPAYYATLAAAYAHFNFTYIPFYHLSYKKLMSDEIEDEEL